MGLSLTFEASTRNGFKLRPRMTLSDHEQEFVMKLGYVIIADMHLNMFERIRRLPDVDFRGQIIRLLIKRYAGV